MVSSRLAFMRFALLALVVVLLTAGTLVVVERLGVPPRALAFSASGAVLALGVVSGLASGAMRLPVFLTQGRALPASGVSLATAIMLPFGLPGQPALGVALGLMLAAFTLGPALRRSGAPTWPSYLGARFSSPPLRVLAAIVLAAVALGLGAAALTHAADAIGRALGVSPGKAAAWATAATACAAVAGGARSSTRAAVGLGFVVLACAGALWLGGDAGGPERALGLLAPLTRPNGLALGVAAALCALAFPAYQTIWPGIDQSEDARIALLWAGVLVGVIGYAVGPALHVGPGLVSPIASDAMAVAAGVAVAGALLLAAGQALGYDLKPRVDRRRTPASSRLALMRFGTLAMVACAGVAAGFKPAIVASLSDTASAILVGALAPPILLGACWDRANATGAIVALIGGLVTVLALLDGRIGSPDLGEAGAGLVACAVALTAGALATLFTRRSAQTPRPLADDML